MGWTVRNPVLRVQIRTEGPLAALGHDRVFAQPVEVMIEAVPSLDGATVRAEGDLRRTELLGHASASDRAEILKRKDQDVLQTQRFPVFRFEGRYEKGNACVAGTLSLHGADCPVRLPVSLMERSQGVAMEGTVLIDLRQFGIKPYKAFLGALRVAPEVEVTYSLKLEAGSEAR